MILHKTRSLVSRFLFYCCMSGLSPLTWGQSGDELLFRNAHVIVGDGSELRDTDVLVRQGQIVAIGENLALENRDATLVNLGGKTLLPSFIDAHAHLGYQSASGWGAEYYGRENLIRNLKQYLYYGFTAVFSAGSDPDDLALALQVDQRSGEFTGAQFLFAAGMAPPGEGPNNQFLVHTSQIEQELEMTILRGLSSPEQAREQVREVAAKGIRFIKLWVDDRGGLQTKLAPELYRAVADEAKARGMQVFIHQQFAEDMPDILSAGVHGFLHGRIGEGFTDAIAQQAADAGVFIVPNLGLGELRREAIGIDEFLVPVLHPPLLSRMGDAGGMRQRAVVRNVLLDRELAAGFARIEEAGADIILGTDAGAVPDHPFGYTGHRELEIYVRLGMSEMNALMAATSKAAKHLNLNDQGLVAPGHRANLLILNADPLQNIRNTREIHSVYLNGMEIDRTELLEQIMQ